MTNLRRSLWMMAGLVSAGLGAAGVVLPVLPAAPFVLLAAFCFAKGSARLSAWFQRTKLYRTCLERFAKDRRMTRRAKLALLLPVSAALLLTAAFLPVMALRVLVLALLLAKIIVFVCFVPTKKPKHGTAEASAEPSNPKPAEADGTLRASGDAYETRK